MYAQHGGFEVTTGMLDEHREFSKLPTVDRRVRLIQPETVSTVNVSPKGSWNIIVSEISTFHRRRLVLTSAPDHTP